jgi:hypothetical protein
MHAAVWPTVSQLWCLSFHIYIMLQLLEKLLQQFQEMDEELRKLWVSPSAVELSADVIADGGTSRVHHGFLRGVPVAVKVYYRRCRQARPQQSPACAPCGVEAADDGHAVT